MSNIFATWMYIVDDEHGASLPSAKGLSSENKIQDIYWRCLACCFFTARYYNPSIVLMFFSNVRKLPVIDNLDFTKLFENLNVESHFVEYDFEPPLGYHKNWGHTFYEFSIFQYAIGKMDREDTIILVDSDVLVTGNLAPVFNQAKSNSFIGYTIDYKPDQIVNGRSRRQLQDIFQILHPGLINDLPTYYGGEIHASSVGFLRLVMVVFEEVWAKQLEFHRKNLPKFLTEEHVLSFIYQKLGVNHHINANSFIKRLWTDPSNYRNVVDGDEKLVLWHLPAQKRYGFKIMFAWLMANNFRINSIDNFKLSRKVCKTFSIPNISLQWKIYFSLKKIAKKALNR